MSKRYGFTLMELAIVLAMVALLAAMLLPTVRHAATQPRNAMCLQNQSTVWKGLVLYASDWDGRLTRNMLAFDGNNRFLSDYIGEAYYLPWSNAIVQVPRAKLDDPARANPPMAGYPAYAASRSNLWQSQISYAPDLSTFQCPAANRAADAIAFSDPQHGAYGSPNDWWFDIQGTYGMNMRMSSWNFMNHRKVLKPGECFFFADSWACGFDHVWQDDDWLAARHGPNGDLVNIMFHDGHTAAYRWVHNHTNGCQIPFPSSLNGTPWYGGDANWRN